MLLVADAINDVCNRKAIVLDPFGRSGTTIMAAEKTGRRASRNTRTSRCPGGRGALHGQERRAGVHQLQADAGLAGYR